MKPPTSGWRTSDARSVIDWDRSGPGAAPRHRLYRAPLPPLPDMSNDDLAGLAERTPEFLFTMYRVFHGLFRHGYRFAWFDTIPRRRHATCYYFMDNPFAL